MTNKMSRILAIAVLFALAFPLSCFAAIPTAKQKTLTGTVTKIYGNQIVFRTTSAAGYTAETSQTQLARKNGAAMKFSEILVGDKVEVKGLVWTDNSINASYVRNMSLYAHNSTFTGKIVAINPLDSSFTIYSKKYGYQTIHTDSFTVFKKNSSSATFKDLDLNYSMTVKGVWDRDNTNIMAKEATASVRLINISLTGTVFSKTSTGLTVISNNVIYGVDIGKAKLQNKKGKTITLGQINLGDAVKVEGKHISESNQVTASLIKDNSLTK